MLYEISCTKLQLPPELLTRGLPPTDPRSLCPLFSTEFVETPPPEQNSWVRHCSETSLWSAGLTILLKLLSEQYVLSLLQVPSADTRSYGSYNEDVGSILPPNVGTNFYERVTYKYLERLHD